MDFVVLSSIFSQFFATKFPPFTSNLNILFNDDLMVFVYAEIVSLWLQVVKTVPIIVAT